MRRPDLYRYSAPFLPLAAMAGLLALPGCVAAPAIGLASHLMNPSAAGGSSAGISGMPSADMFASLARRIGVALPGQPAATPLAAANPTTPNVAVPSPPHEPAVAQ